MTRARSLTIAVLACLLAPAVSAQGTDPVIDPEHGVSETLARERAVRIADVRYDLSFSIPSRRTDTITGRAVITFTLKDASRPLAIDFAPDRAGALHRIDINTAPGEPRLVNGHIVLPVSALRRGSNTVTVVFDAGNAPLNRNDDFMYTIFVPARAHEAFPCFDQPDLKARWTLTLDAPNDWLTVANTASTNVVRGAERSRSAFAESAPLPTYLFAFAAGTFSVEEAVRRGRTFRMFHRETDAQKVARNRDAIFDLHDSALAWLERYTAIPYPFGKFDFVLVPAFQFGGMEHPGAVFYNAAGLMLDESATQNQRLDRASVIAHETAHMWFGDLVTMRWFTDVWMKEVFANFMAAKIVNPSFPDINHDLRFLHGYYPAAYDVDRTAGTNAVRQPLDNLRDAGTLYGAIIYQKAPIVMRQLEHMLGADPFRDGLRQYLSRHAFGNASWSELIALLDARTDADLAAWSHAWVEEAGRPIIRTDLASSEGRVSRLALTVDDADARRGLMWTQDVTIALGYQDRVDLLPVRLENRRTDVIAARGRPVPLYVLPNGGGVAYGAIHLDPESLAWLSNHLFEVDDALTRGSAWITLWDAALNAEIDVDRFLELTLEALPREPDELNVQRILAYAQQTYWRFLSPADRLARAPQVERMLRQELDRAATSSLKSAFFSALRDVALTEETIGWLTRIWRGDERVEGLTLAEPDFIALSQELAVREAPGWNVILQEQIAKTANPDRKARLSFIVPALSSEEAERDRFFDALADIANRRHESWVLDGLHYLHHPLRAASSIKYIPRSLDLLADIQRTGDIFFPKRWMDSTLSGHRSPEAARIVRTFLERAPSTYPDRLRRIVLSSSDDLFRASRLAARAR